VHDAARACRLVWHSTRILLATRLSSLAYRIRSWIRRTRGKVSTGGAIRAQSRKTGGAGYDTAKAEKMLGFRAKYLLQIEFNF
jgi:hypothetical protein